MSVTAMYVELLVVGLGGLIWAALFIFSGHSDKLITILYCTDFKNYVAIILPFVLSAAYVLGILIDKASKGIMWPVNKILNIILNKILKTKDSNYEAIIVESESATTVLNYMRSKIRILRGYIFNWPLIGYYGSKYLESTETYKNLSSIVSNAGYFLAGITLGLYIYNECLCRSRVDRFCVALKNKLARNGSPPVCETEEPAKTPKPD